MPHLASLSTNARNCGGSLDQAAECYGLELLCRSLGLNAVANKASGFVIYSWLHQKQVMRAKMIDVCWNMSNVSCVGYLGEERVYRIYILYIRWSPTRLIKPIRRKGLLLDICHCCILPGQSNELLEGHLNDVYSLKSFPRLISERPNLDREMNAPSLGSKHGNRFLEELKLVAIPWLHVWFRYELKIPTMKRDARLPSKRREMTYHHINHLFWRLFPDPLHDKPI